MSEFKRHVLTLASGTVLAQAIPIAVMPLLTRFYTPDQFAALAGFMALVSVLGVVVAGRYELTIMHASDKLMADHLTMLALLVTVGSALLLGGFAAVLAQPITQLMGQPSLLPWMYWLALPLAATGVMQIFSTWLNWCKDYRSMAGGRVMQNACVAAINLSLGWGKNGGSGLLLGHVAGLLCAALYFWRKTQFRMRSLAGADLRGLAKRYRHYPAYSAPAALLDVISMNACIFILGRFYPHSVLGQFSLTHRLLLVPMALVGASVAQAFFQHAAEASRRGDSLYPLLMSTSRKLLLYSLPLFVLFVLLAPDLFALLFGATWRTAGEYARIVAVAYWLRLAVSPISSVFMVVDRLKIGTLWQLIYFCTSVTVLGGGAWLQLPVIDFFILYAAHEAVLYGLYFWLARRVCQQDKKRVAECAA